MRVYTSYYSNWKNLRQTGLYVPVRISASKPTWFEDCDSIPKVFPSWELINGYKSGQITEDEYSREYALQLGSLNKQAILARLLEISSRHDNKDIVLLCWEGKGKFCHRYQLGEWLGCNVTEL